jgi:hypothetical protein
MENLCDGVKGIVRKNERILVLGKQKLEIQTIDTKIVVINRGSWGELRFLLADG